MVKNLIFFLVAMVGIINAQYGRASQNLVLDNFYNVKSNEGWVGPVCQEELSYELILPRDFESTSHAGMPLFIVLDRQNTSSYKNTLNTIDFLTSLSALPSSGIIGFGFKDGMQRHQLSKYGEAKISLDNFLKDIVSLVKDEIEVNNINVSDVVVIGHSRTGYVAMQFLFNYPDFISAAIAGSPQSISTEKELNVFKSFLAEINKSNKKHQLYYSSGEEVMGDGDEQETRALLSFFKPYKKEANFCVTGQVFKCDHYNSLGIVINQNLIRLFDGYNRALQYCFDKINAGEITSYDKAAFSAVYKKMSKETGIEVKPDASFYISVFYAFFNDYNNNFGEKKMEYAEAVLQDGLSSFPNDYRLIYHYLYMLFETNRKAEAEKFFAEKLSVYDNYVWLNEQLKKDELTEVDLLFEAYK